MGDPVLIQRSRFKTILKNLVGFRGPISLDLLPQVQPGFDVGSFDQLLDDEVAYWIAGALTVTAGGAGKTSQIAVFLGTTLPANARFSVDGLHMRAQATASTFTYGLAPKPAGLVTVATDLRNNFLSQRTATFGAAYTLNAVQIGSANTAVASGFTGSTFACKGDMIAAGSTLFIDPFPGFVVTPDSCFLIEADVNLPLALGAMWGRYYADQT